MSVPSLDRMIYYFEDEDQGTTYEEVVETPDDATLPTPEGFSRGHKVLRIEAGESFPALAPDTAAVAPEDLAEPESIADLHYHFLTRDDLVNAPPQLWLLDGILPQDALCSLVGESGIGKSFLALGWACSIATGAPWLDREVQSGGAVYITAEGKYGLGKRLQAWEVEYQMRVPERLHVLYDTLCFKVPEDVKLLVEDLRRLPEQPKLIVVDTLNKFFGSGDENSAADMSRFLAGLRQVQEAIGATIVVLHHPTKDGFTYRGSSALRGDLDTLLTLRQQKDVLVLSCNKQRDYDDDWQIGLLLDTVMLGDGSTSCIITASDTIPLDDGPLTDNDLHMLRVLAEDFPDGAGSTEWLNSAGLSSHQFYDGRKRLVDGGYVNQEGESGTRGVRYSVIEPVMEVLSGV